MPDLYDYIVLEDIEKVFKCIVYNLWQEAKKEEEKEEKEEKFELDPNYHKVS